MLNRKKLTPQQALQKIKHYCAYQERCHQEVADKLYGFGLNRLEVDTITSTLIEENYLNEERFACQFAGGKFRMNQWGRKKITYALQQKRVSAWCIKNALAQIDDDAYQATLHKLAAAKWQSLQGEHPISRQAKTQAYLMQKGFEPAYISAAVAALRNA